MSEQDGIQSSPKQHRSRKTNTAHQGNGKQAPSIQRPTNDDTEAWKAYWKAQEQPWRAEPEIDEERQKYLGERRTIEPNFEQGIYPFKDIKLSRADVEWLLARHESKGIHGPVLWDEEKDKPEYERRTGLDLRGADLREINLKNLPLAGTCAGPHWVTTPEGWLNAPSDLREKARIHLEKANLSQAHLEGCKLVRAYMEGASLVQAHLEEANLSGIVLTKANLTEAHLEKVNLTRARMEGANLLRANLERANLDGAFFDNATYLVNVTLGKEKSDCASLIGVHWGDVDLSAIRWTAIKILGDEREAGQTKTSDGTLKDKDTRISEYRAAVKANWQLAVVLREQGMSEVADHFAYRSQVLLRKVFWFQMKGQQVNISRRVQSLGRWLFSWFLSVVAGYGYKPYRCFEIYLLALIGFTIAHYLVGAIDGHSLTFINALAVSVQSLHGRLFSFQASDPQTILNTIEAFFGLFIEAIVVAVITQRILGK